MWLTVFILSFLLFGSSQAGNNDGKCEITKFTDVTWEVYLQPEDKVYDNVNNLIVYDSPYTNKLTDLVCVCTSSTCNENYDYINIKNNNSDFFITTTDHMTDLDKDIPKTTNPSIKLVYSCTMKCNTDRNSTLPVNIDIYDKNNHAPTFEEKSYSYKVASPLMPISDFTLFGKTIKAEDLDFSNTDMNFTIQPDDFHIFTTVDPTNEKKYVANIRANKVITINRPTTYTLTAQDNGQDPGPLNATVEITIDVDDSLSWDIPYFEYSNDTVAAYTFQYSSTDNQLIPLTGSIKLNTNKPDSVTNLQLSGEMKDYFKAEFEKDTKTFDLSLVKSIENPTSASTALTLSVKTDTEASTLIIIKFSELPSGAVTFKNHSYTGSYDDIKNVLTVDQTIELIVTTNGTPTFALTGDFSDNFSIQYDGDKKTCTLNVTTALTPEQIQSKTYLTLTLQATLGEASDKSVIVILLPSHELKFTQILYSATYNENNTVNIDAKNPIAFTSDAINVTVTVDEPYTQYFKINEKLTIDVLTPLTSEILSTETELAVILTAKDAYGNQPQAVIKMALPLQQTIDAPKFSQLYYTVQYSETDEVIDFPDPLTFDNVDDPTTVTISLNAYTDNFKIYYDSSTKKWKIKIVKPLDSTVFSTRSELVLKMTANETGSNKTGAAVLVIELIDPDQEETIQFSQISYIAQYTKGQTKDIEFTKDITFTNVGNVTKIKIDLDSYTENFNVYYNSSSKKWKIKIQKPLNSTMFSTKSELVLVMTASETGSNKTGAAVLVMELKDPDQNETIQFSQISYVAQYTKGQSEDIDFTEEITFENVENVTKIKIDLDSYTENFNIYYNSSTKNWKIKIKKPLDSTTFNTKSVLVLTMTASETGSTKTGAAVLVIELEDPDQEETIQFSKISYIAQCTKEQTKDIEFTDAITFENVEDVTKIKIDLDSYTDNFNVYYNSSTKKWKIKIKKPLNSTVFSTKSELVLTMTASQTGSTKTGTAVLVIELEDPDQEEKIQFSQISYIAQYTKGQSKDIEFTKEITFENVEDVTKMKIDLDTYTDNFNIYYDSSTKKWKIKIKKPLDSTLFSTKSDLVLTMTASQTGSTKTGIAVLVMELIDSDQNGAIQFSDSYYVAQYAKDQKTGYIDFDRAIQFENENVSEISINLNNYSQNFEVTYTSNKWRLHVIKPLDSAVFDAQQDLILVMTATQTETKRTGKSVLIIELQNSSVDSKIPQFKEAYYTALYPKTGKGTITFDNDIAFDNVDDVSKVNITISSYSENFVISYNTTASKWLIDIKTPLDDATLSSNTYLTSTLSASIEGDDKHTPVAGFVLKLPDHEVKYPPVFSKSYFKAEYNIQGNEAKVTFNDEIGFDSDVEAGNIEIVSDEYSNYLSFVYDTNTKKWQAETNGILDLKSLEGSELVVAITATDKTTKLQGRSVIVLALPKRETEDAPRFSKTYYQANYNLSADKPSVDLEDLIDITNRKDMSKISIAIDNSYSENFAISYANDKWQITVKKNLDQEILNKQVDIIMGLIAADSANTSNVGLATLLITLPIVNNDDAPQFTSIFYEAQCDSSTKILETSPITIKNKLDLSKIDVKILETKYQSNFEIQLNSTTRSWQVSVVSLPEEAAKLGEALVLTLTATEQDNTNIGQTALVINFPALDAPKFSSNHFLGDYKVLEDSSSFTMDDVIITNRDDQSNIELSLSDSDTAISDYFKYTFDDVKKIWKITLEKSLDETYTSGKTQLILTLSATEKNNSNVGYATVIINLPSDGTDDDFKFSDVHYVGNYVVTQNKPMVQLEEDIQLVSSLNLTAVEFKFVVSDDLDLNEYFRIDKATTNYEVSVLKALPDEILKKRSLVVTLQATLGTKKSTTTLVINLPTVDEENAIDFSKLLYNGTYESGTLTVEEIDIVTNEDSKNLNVTISSDSPYASYFKATLNEKIVTLTVTEIPDDVLEKITVIPLTLIALSSGTTKTGAAIVNINTKHYQGSMQFDSALFNGKYELTNGEVKVTADPITLTTDQEDKRISVAVDNAMASYFEVSYSSSKVSLSLTSNIPDDILQNASTVSVVLTASIEDTDVKSQTVVNLRIITDTQPDNTGILQFSDVLFTGEYSVENGKGVFKQDGDIGLQTDRQEDEITVQISEKSVLREYFSVSYKNQKVTVTLNNDLPDEDFNSRKVISLTLVASITSNQISDSAVLNVLLDNNSDGYVSFDSPVHSGKYKVEKNTATIEYDVITVTTDEEDDKIIATIAQPYSGYFEVAYKEKAVKLELVTDAASSTLRKNKNLPVVVTVRIKDSDTTASTVVNFDVIDADNGGKDNSSISFPNQVYSGEYDVDSNSFKRDDMQIITQHPEGDIEIKLSNEYNYEDYFGVEYKNKKVSINLERALPKKDVLKLGYIALAIRAQLKTDPTIFGDSVLTIKIESESQNGVESNNNDTKYIIAVSILSVLLFLVIIGVIAFYFLIFRKNKYQRMTEEEYINSKVKFDKSTLQRASTDRSKSAAIEERRPTGFVFNNSEIAEPRESTTEGPEQREKSVSFDDKVEKMQIDVVNDEDIEKALKQTTEL